MEFKIGDKAAIRYGNGGRFAEAEIVAVTARGVKAQLASTGAAHWYSHLSHARFGTQTIQGVKMGPFIEKPCDECGNLRGARTCSNGCVNQ